jgi:nucleoside-diphosphate-sugar epimerase
MRTALVTGANGFIGSHLLYRLLKQGWRVRALGRSSKTCRWVERVQAALREVGPSQDLPGVLECLEVDLSAPSLDLGSVVAGAASPAETFLFHVAGDTRFRPADPEAQRRVNVEAPLRLVSSLKGSISRMIHVSTAYVAGKRTGLIRETELDCGQEFWNSYEQSKFDAELALSQLCGQERVPLVIVRPSIIINERETGRASTFTHLNALVEVVNRLQNHYGLVDGQVVSKTIRLMAEPLARPNLAPVDSILPPLIRIAEDAAAPGRVFHLCHPQPQTNPEILDLICEAYGVRQRLALEFVECIQPPLSHTEELVARSLKVYAPYLNSRQELDLTNTRAVVPDYDAHFSPLDVPYLQRVIAFQREKRKSNARKAPG